MTFKWIKWSAMFQHLADVVMDLVFLVFLVVFAPRALWLVFVRGELLIHYPCGYTP